jgi:hypothetical protein
MAIGKNFKQGYYDFPYGERDKCKNANLPQYRSSWEKHLMDFFSKSKRILEWYSELPIPYYSEVKGRMSKYYVDFVVKYRNNKGEMVTELIEVKPYKETQPVVKTRTPKGEKRYIQESLTFMNNQEKWLAAQKYAEERGWIFRILTEREIFRG